MGLLKTLFNFGKGNVLQCEQDATCNFNRCQRRITMGLLKTLFNFGKGKADEAAEKIEDENRVMFASQALNEMEVELNNAIANVGKLKGTKMGIERRIDAASAELQTYQDKARQLKQKGDEGDANAVSLLSKLAVKGETVMQELESNKSQLTLINTNLAQQERNVETLRLNLDNGKRKLQHMKAMEQVTNSTEALLKVNTSGQMNALSKFDSHIEKQQAKLDEANAMLETQTSGDLDSEIDSALGKSAGSSFLNSL